MLQFGQQARKIFSRLFLCKIFIRHMPGEKIQQLIHAFISKISVCIAPFAIVLIKAVIFFSAYKAVVLQRHTAALADKLARTAEQSIYRNIKLLRYFLQNFCIRRRITVFPTWSSLPCNKQSFSHFVLCQIVFCSYFLQYILTI